MPNALAPPTETTVSAVEVQATRISELVGLRNCIDAEIAESVRAYAGAEVDRRLDRIATGQITTEHTRRRRRQRRLPQPGPRGTAREEGGPASPG
ncbi:hypothetical protein [Pseudonocardia pini]|uniref:hypothetical protein n=1 Tax=Pseudonocardia pini TaxID=2758030 RepID=UPI0015F12346|nr:hypothetical protein [Pseudonocardia pini]